MSWQDILKEDANTLIEMLEGLRDKIKKIDEELADDIYMASDRVIESKFWDIDKGIKRASSDLNRASGDYAGTSLNLVNAQGAISTLISILQRYD